jgi:small subunit ribosomal protein S8
MPATDPIADMLTSIRNALQAGHRRVDVPASRVKASIAEVLMREKFIENFRKVGNDKNQGVLRIYLRYTPDNESMIRGLTRVSRPGRRVYVKSAELPRILEGMGTAIVSTPQGIMTDKDARKQGLGGELIATVW